MASRKPRSPKAKAKGPASKRPAKRAKRPAKPKQKTKRVQPAAKRSTPAKTGARKPPVPPLAKPAPGMRRSARHRLAQPLPRPAPGKTQPNALANPYERDLARTPANFQALTPLSFLERAARMEPDRVAIIHGQLRITYREFYARSRQLASSLAGAGVGKNDAVSALLSNTPAMLQVHHGAPMIGAVLNALNTRLDAPAIAFMLDHSEAKIFIVDREFAGVAKEALQIVKRKPRVILYDDREFPQTGTIEGATDYDDFVGAGDPEFAWAPPDDEWDAIALNYTSGTTGNPKGVVYHHRGAALMGYGNILACRMQEHPVYLWTLPMFHCNGWCFPWTLALLAGTHVCLRWVRAKDMYDAIAEHKVTHLSGAPIVMATLLNAKPEEKRAFSHRVNFVHAAAPPPEAVLMAMLDAGFELSHVYGLTETYGPATVNVWHEEWDSLPKSEQGALRIRQGGPYATLEQLTVLDPATLDPVPADGRTLGEVMFRGNIVMKGYLKNPKATADAFAGGWFHSGDLGVMHAGGYIQLKDRSKDIIISGGENISSIEVEETLYRHPAVLFAAVVAQPDDKWGERPCAFIEKRPGADVSEAEIVEFCRANLAHFKCPKNVVFCELPKTTTGKIQKFRLRERAKDLC